MKLEVGKKYLNRLKQAVEIVSYDDSAYGAHRYRDSEGISYTLQGHHCTFGAECEYNLVSEVDEEMAMKEESKELVLEMGKFYKLRNGGKARVILTDLNHPKYTVAVILNIGTELEEIASCTEEGFMYDGVNDPADLVSPWTETKMVECWALVDSLGDINSLYFTEDKVKAAVGGNFRAVKLTGTVEVEG